MENQYDVGTANRYALFLEVGENELPVIKKKLSKALKAKTKQKKENAEAKKVESVKVEEKANIPELITGKSSDFIKDSKHNKNSEMNPKNNSAKRDKNLYDKSHIVKNGRGKASEIESWEKEIDVKNDTHPPRKNNDNRKPRDRNYDNNEQHQSKNYSGFKKYNNHNRDLFKNDSTNGDMLPSDVSDWNTQDNSNDQQQSDYKPRGGNKYRGGGRNNYSETDRKRNYSDNRRENNNKEDANNLTSNTWNEEKPENVDNSNDHNGEIKAENDLTSFDQKDEIKEMLTLDEWKKMKGEREKPQYNLRKAGEGEDLSQWKNMRELQKSKEGEFLDNGNNNNNNNNNISKKVEDKENSILENNQLDVSRIFKINYHYEKRGGRNSRVGNLSYKEKNDDRYDGESRSFRRSRGGRVGRSDRGGEREHPRQNAPIITDERAFPSLG